MTTMKLCRHATSLQATMTAIAVGLLSCALGCGGHEPSAVLDATALLERYDKARQRQDPTHYTETDLGEFTVTKRPDKDDPAADPDDPAIYFIRFHLFAVVDDEQATEFTELMVTHGERVRSKVRETVQSGKLDQWKDPDLGWLKSELIQWINRSVNTPIVRNVVFADFSFERS
jgi:hypothetical protein